MFRFHKCSFFSLTPQYLKPFDDPVWNCAVRVRVFIKVIIVPLFFKTIAVIVSGLCKTRVWTFLMSLIFLSVRFPFFSLIWYDRGAIWHIMIPLSVRSIDLWSCIATIWSLRNVSGVMLWCVLSKYSFSV